MQDAEKSKEILVEIAEKISAPSDTEVNNSSVNIDLCNEPNFNGVKFEPPAYDDLVVKKGEQTLKEREKLLDILRKLFTIQLIAMNIIVFAVVAWIVLDIPWFTDVTVELSNAVIGLIKYYVTAVLVELLGGVIYIVHNVFSDKTIDKLNSSNNK